MRSRRRSAPAIAWVLAAGVALTAPAAIAQSVDGLPDSRFQTQSERFTPDGGTPIDLTFMVARETAAQTTRLVDGTHAALTMMNGWFGALPAPSLTVAGVPWRNGASAPDRPGLVTAPLRWLVSARDQSTERALIGSIVRQYWTAKSVSSGPFQEALIHYTATRAIHQLLEGSNFDVTRNLGGFVPFPLRGVLLSPKVADPRPRVWGFSELGPADAEVLRGVRALQTIERYVGWPSQLEALARLRQASPPRYDAAAFAEALSAVRGTDLRFLVQECLRTDATFDYALDSLQSQPGGAGLIETTVTISRRGEGKFAVRSGGDPDATMPVMIRFADGTEFRDVFDGAAPTTALVYSAKTAAISASVDPDVMLLLDANRENNTVVRDVPPSPLGFRLALNWMSWLQNAMLTYTALL